MKYILNQYQGLGDILFCEPIARYFYNDGTNEIVWPVLKDFLWLQEYFPYIQFVDHSTYNFPYESTYLGQVSDNEIHIPLRFANPIVRNLHPHDYSDQYHTMLDKYRMLGMPEDMWKTIKWIRNITRENELYNMLITQPKYTLVNNYWSDGVLDIPLIDDIYKDTQIVYMNRVSGYTLLDWAKVIENATYIHTVSTSNIFLLETLQLKASNVYIYPRLPRENNFDGIREFVNPSFKLVL
jgi:hypothetical protein